MPPPARPGSIAFQSRDFRFFFGARLLSAFASLMIDTGVAWLVYDITGSAFALGLTGLFSFLPNVLFILVVGHVADRYDRRVVLIACYSCIVLASASLVYCAAQPSIDVTIIYGLIFVFGTARAFSSPASQALLPTIVPREHFANAMTIASSTWQFAAICGPAVAGVVYIFGAPAVFSVTTLFYLGSLACLLPIKPRIAAAASKDVTWESLTAGFRYIWRKKIIFGAISVDLFAVLLGGATALLPIYAKDIFHVGPVGLGVLRCMPAVGALVCTLVLAWTGLGGRAGMKMFGAVIVFGFATVGFGLSTNFWIALPFLFILGAADMVSVMIRNVLVQIETPNEMRGRVSAVNSIFIGASNELGEFESGTLAAIMGPVAAVVLGGVGSVLIALTWMKMFPGLRDRDALT